ncbi:MAG: zinc-finger domain-containing protein [Gemmobacter sp.]
MPAHDAPEAEVVSRWKIACDGGEGALGHPRVWLVIPEESGWVDCGYCDKRFVHESAAARIGLGPGKAA